MNNGPVLQVPSSQVPVNLDVQTGMPPVYPSRSKELLYDSLLDDSRFVLNPFGPQHLNLSRPNHRW